MIFAKSIFILFFSILFFIHLFLPHKFRWIVLLPASYLFYGMIEITFPLWLLIITVMVYLAGRWIGNGKRKGKWALWVSLLVPLGALVYFKYTGFFLTVLNTLFHQAPQAVQNRFVSIVIPVGISFYVFKAVSYLVDVYRGNMKAERHFGYLALYISFFPQLLAGPIERSSTFLPELKKKDPFQLEDVSAGLKLFLWGLFKKLVIADNLARFVDQVFSEPGSYAGFSLLMGVLFFSFQIYADFSGYSDMAIGLGRVLGYHTHINFNYPYFSRNIREFWSRWHISLSFWLRDYLFLPLAYSYMRRMKRFENRFLKLESQAYIWATLITMLLGGLWHGANWTYVSWGGLLGVFLIVSYLTRKVRKKVTKALFVNKMKPYREGFRVAWTFGLVSFAWIFFRAESVTGALTYISGISLRMETKGMGHILFLSVLVLIFIAIEILMKGARFNLWLSRIPWPVRTAGYAFVICSIIIFGADSSNEFLYFSF